MKALYCIATHCNTQKHSNTYPLDTIHTSRSVLGVCVRALQPTATHCNTQKYSHTYPLDTIHTSISVLGVCVRALQPTATHCNTHKYRYTYTPDALHTTVSVLECVLEPYSQLQHTQVEPHTVHLWTHHIPPHKSTPNTSTCVLERELQPCSPLQHTATHRNRAFHVHLWILKCVGVCVKAVQPTATAYTPLVDAPHTSTPHTSTCGCV